MQTIVAFYANGTYRGTRKITTFRVNGLNRSNFFIPGQKNMECDSLSNIQNLVSAMDNTPAFIYLEQKTIFTDAIIKEGISSHWFIL